MKKMKLFMVALVCLTMQSVTCLAGDDVLVSVDQLPTPALQFIAENFGNHDITTIEMEKKGLKTTYEVSLNDGTSIEFTKSGKWKKIDCVTNAVPSQLVPASIAQYVNRNFPGQKVVELSQDMMGYEVELSNDVDLTFSQQQFLGMY